MFASISYRPAELHNHFLLQLPRMKTSSQPTVIVAPKTPCDLVFCFAQLTGLYLKH